MLADGGNPGTGAPGPDTVVLVGSDEGSARLIGEMLRTTWPSELRVAAFPHPCDAAQELLQRPTAWVLLDLSSSPADRIRRVSQLRALAPGAPILVLGEREDEAEGLAAIQAGAQDYLIKPELYPGLLRRALTHAAERARAEMRLTHQALHDQLTGLPNRALFIDRVGVALDRRRRSSAAVAVLFLDVDNFKEINDSLGHAAGDRVLIGLADRLRTMLRPMDTVSRYGGDEFTLLFEDLDNEREVVLIAERISEAAALPLRLEDGAIEVTVSIGVAVVSDPDVSPETVIREADAAMYRAKRSGPSRFELFDDASRRRAMARLELEQSLHRALSRSELCVHYQPTFWLEDPARLCGLEALVRWRHPERGLLFPGEFISLAEETGLIVPIDRYVLEHVLRRIPQWRRQAAQVMVSVNISARELEDVSLLSILGKALHSSAVHPRALCLEFSDAAISDRPEAAIRTMQGLKAMGVRLAIDDFGMGASSLSRLKRLPVDTLKVHQSLLSGLGRSPRDASVVGAVVELGHSLGMTVVAEGVETDAQVSELRALGCDAAQGFWFGRPVAEVEVPQLLSPGARAAAGSSP